MTGNQAVSIDPKLFRDVMGHYPTGVVVVTAKSDDGEILAMVVGTFNSVSLDPPLVSFMPMKSSRTFSQLLNCPSMCINVLGGEQEDIVLTISQRWENKLEGIDWYESPSGDPILADAVAWIDARIATTVDAGDHMIVLCSVRDLSVTNPVSPLLFFQGGYGSFVLTSLMARMDHEILPAINQAHAVRTEVKGLADEIGCEVSLLTAVSSDEMTRVLWATAPGVDSQLGLSPRVPMVPPIGDTYMFDQSDAQQTRWLDRLRDVSEDVRSMHLERLGFVRKNGYLLSFLPPQGETAYDELRRASREYGKTRLTPAQERRIRESIGNSAVDYRLREIDPSGTYDVASLVMPVRVADGGYSLTLRLAQFPSGVAGATVLEWLDLARAVVSSLENNCATTAPA
ncbi:flavin reductase family protein [Mycobacterium kyogaense]|uniref:flavin reductase family protein n=1 Tax=Mycobacterium kyogaense TaxID=2212479 RepID=UPI000DACCCC1|nr:flavin reductase family protein [Mycobacterium kyogaense]